MKISIIGSWRDDNGEWGLRGSQTEFEEACLSIGRELGHHRQTVIVSGESRTTADLHVARGVVEAVRHQSLEHPLIEVLRPVGNLNAYEDLARQNPGLFSFHVPTPAHWAEVHLLSLREASVVIAIAGMRGTYQAGLAAIVAKKRLVPVASFGGAAVRLSTALENIGGLTNSSDYRYLNGPWSKQSLSTVAKLANVGQPPRVLLIHGHSTDWLRVKDWLREKAKVQEVIIMQQEFGGGRTLPEKFEQLASAVDVAIAIATPDDLGGLVGTDLATQRKRARQNVWLEVGWFWGRLGRDRIFVLSRGQIELPSDLLGIEYYEYADDPMEHSERLRSFLRIARRGEE